MTISPHESEQLGGRLRLLEPDSLSDEQRQLYDRLEKAIGPLSERDGTIARLDDGRLIGPFNPMLRTPRLSAAFAGWVAEIDRAEISEVLRQVLILTVASVWRADYEIYAHVAAARGAGVPEPAITAILSGYPPEGLDQPSELGHRLALTLLTSHDVPDALYAECVDAFGEAGMIAMLSLIGEYQLVSALLVCFRVPAPTRT